MTGRERFRETLLFGTPDRVPFEPGGPRESTLKVWHEQGLPEGVNWRDYLLDLVGVQREPSQPHVDLDVSFKMIPTFEEKVLEHRDGHYIVQDWMGAVTEIADNFDYTYIRAARDFVTRKWHRFPVQNRSDFEEKIKRRYDPRDPERFPSDFEARCAALKDRDYVVSVSFNGPFWQLREWCGFEGLCELMIEQPDLVTEMAEFWTAFVLETMRPILERVDVDHVLISEDMAYKAHSMISPAMTRRFLVPSYHEWVPAVKAAGCPIVEVDSDGYVGELIPIWIESDIRCNSPLEVAAGNDIIEYRRLYGREMAYRGGIDKRAMAAGGETMRAEVLRVVPPLLKDGGFIPSCDHGVPPDISWPNFVEYTRLLAQLTGWL
ncbi:MAG: uroporphyrinogen decarboxylase family protein [Anaerolineae bacterium]